METLAELRANRNRHRLPEPIGDEKYFTWGPVEKLHKIPELNIIVIEYHDQIFENGCATGKYAETTMFHLHDSSSSFESLEAAIIFGISKFKGVHDDYARAACKLLDV